jgi:hypothetical protein
MIPLDFGRISLPIIVGNKSEKKHIIHVIYMGVLQNQSQSGMGVV